MDKLLKILSEMRPDLDFAEETRLIDDGFLDSFDVIALVTELNETFNVEINVSHLTPENFNSADAIWRLIERLTLEQ